MRFRADVNGLRALAILSVVFYHYKLPGFPGGFVGVDIFFVISGYLLTSIARNSIQNGTYSWRDFLSHRARRIIPALAAMLLVCIAAGAITLLPYDYIGLTKNARSSILFWSNVSYSNNANYFSPDSHTNILLHTWSLSVEWQFYLIFAFLCMVFWTDKWDKRARLGAALFCGLGFGLPHLVSSANSDSAVCRFLSSSQSRLGVYGGLGGGCIW